MNVDVIVPFKWILSSQRLHKLNPGSNLKKYICKVINNEWHVVLKKRIHGVYSMKLTGARYSKSNRVELKYQLNFYRAGTSTPIYKRSSMITNNQNTRKVLWKKAVKNVIKEEHKLIIKGKFRFRIYDLEDLPKKIEKKSRKKKKSTTVNQPVSLFFPDTVPTCDLPQKCLEVLDVKKEELTTDNCIPTLIPENSLKFQVVRYFSKYLETVNDESVSTAMQDHSIDCKVEEALSKDLETANDGSNSTVMPDHSFDCQVVEALSKDLEIINDDCKSIVMLDHSIDCQDVEDLSDLETANNDCNSIVMSDHSIDCQIVEALSKAVETVSEIQKI